MTSISASSSSSSSSGSAASQEVWTVVGSSKKKKAQKSVAQIVEDDSKEPSSLHPACLRRIANAHQDDIHCALRLSGERFVTGSKDGALKIWDFEGSLVKNVYVPPSVNYKSWITALCTIGEHHWLSGTRDGYVTLWENQGSLVRYINTEPYFVSHICKNRNAFRVNCLAEAITSGGPKQFFAGWPTQFTLQTWQASPRKAACVTDQNDWVYSILPLAQEKILAVTGTRLDLWENDGAEFPKNWNPTELFSQQENGAQGNQRPYISSAVSLADRAGSVGLSFFGGYVRIFDLEAQEVLFQQKEHEKRVWTILPFNAHEFASCADDGLIKIWDVRQDGSVATIQEELNVAQRVSVLLQGSGWEFLSGACPDDVYQSAAKASISFWDRRKA